eukprot:3256981-Prorocentrum_lima.AAC.1
MTSSLVGSEMCIRDSWNSPLLPALAFSVSAQGGGMDDLGVLSRRAEYRACLLYTSDAADDM